MKYYVYKTHPSPAKILLSEHSVYGVAVVSDETCDNLGFAPVNMPERPEGTVRPVATLVDGEWVGSWELLTDELTQRELQEAAVLGRRYALLAGSDWTQVADAPVDKSAWALYRQALRDITDQPGFPHDVVWPTQP